MHQTVIVVIPDTNAHKASRLTAARIALEEYTAARIQLISDSRATVLGQQFDGFGVGKLAQAQILENANRS